MKKMVLTAAIAVLMALPGTVLAQQAGATKENIVIGGKQLFTLRASDEATLSQRTSAIYDRLATIGPDIKPEDVKVRWMGAEPSIFVKGNLLVTVTKDDAMTNNSTVGELAREWKYQIAGGYLQIAANDNISNTINNRVPASLNTPNPQ